MESFGAEPVGTYNNHYALKNRYKERYVLKAPEAILSVFLTLQDALFLSRGLHAS
jgi:hypothetical protein